MNGFASLWTRRCRVFWRNASRYWADAARSGFGLLLAFLLIMGIALYSRVLPDVPADFPYLWVAVPVLAPALAAGRPRTFLRPADRVFLLPAEAELGGYFRRAFRYSFAVQAALALAAVVALWPLYRHCAGAAAAPLPLLAALTLLAKRASLLAAWRESRLARTASRRLLAALRWLFSAAFAAALFGHSALAASALLLLAAGVWAAATARMASFPVVNWEELIREEERQLARHYLFYSWFADVPQLPVRVRSRRLLAGITRLLPFAQRSTHLYLYSKTLVRSELAGIVFRLTALGVLFLFLFPHPAVRAAVCVLALLLSGTQLSVLEQAHRHSPFLFLYPGGERARLQAVASVIFVVLACEALVLTAALLAGGSAALAAAVFLGGTGYAYVYAFIAAKRKFRRQSLQLQ